MRFYAAYLTLSLVLAPVAFCADLFPSIEAENLLGKKVELPEAAKGRATVLVIGFTHASESQTKPWTERLAADFDHYSIAVLEDAPRLVRGMAVAGIKGSVPKDQRDRFLVIFKGEKEMKAAVGFERPDDAYVVLLDPDGSIVWRFHGAVNENALGELKTRIAGIKKE